MLSWLHDGLGVVHAALKCCEEGDDGGTPLVHVTDGEAQGRADEGHLGGGPGDLPDITDPLLHHVQPPFGERLRPAAEARSVPFRLGERDTVPEKGYGDALPVEGIGNHEGAPARLHVGVHGDSCEIEETARRDVAHRLVLGEPSREVVEDIVVSSGEDVLEIGEHLPGGIDPSASGREAEDVIGIHGGWVVPKPQGKGGPGILQDRQLLPPQFHEVVRGIVEVKDADAIPVDVGEVGGEHGGDRRLSDTTLFVVYAEPYHQIKV